MLKQNLKIGNKFVFDSIKCFAKGLLRMDQDKNVEYANALAYTIDTFLDIPMERINKLIDKHIVDPLGTLQKLREDEFDIDEKYMDLVLSILYITKNRLKENNYQLLIEKSSSYDELAQHLTNEYIQSRPNIHCEYYNDFLHKKMPKVLSKVIEYSLEDAINGDEKNLSRILKNMDSNIYINENEIINIKKRIDERASIIQDENNQCDTYRDKWNEKLFLEDNEEVTLGNTFVLQDYSGYKDEEYGNNLDVLLNHFFFETESNDLLVIRGQPGSGKSTLISYLLNDQKYSKLQNIIVYPFKAINNIDWIHVLSNSRNMFCKLLNVNSLDNLRNMILIFDGLDEINLQRERNYACLINQFCIEFCKPKFEQNNVKIIITSRFNRFNIVDLESKCNCIDLLPFGEVKINDFITNYNDCSHKNKEKIILSNYVNNIEKVLGIPHILYMILSTNIEITNDLNLLTVYDKLFSINENSKNSVYYRAKYDNLSHDITVSEVNAIHDFSKEVALKIWETNPDEAILTREEYEPIAKRVIQDTETNLENPELHKLLIGQYFYQGEKDFELYFVHRSMYEYFVALSICDSIENLLKINRSVNVLFMEKDNILVDLAKKLSICHIGINDEIQMYLYNMLSIKIQKIFLPDDLSDFELYCQNFYKQFAKYGIYNFISEKSKQYTESYTSIVRKNIIISCNLFKIFEQIVFILKSIDRYSKYKDKLIDLNEDDDTNFYFREIVLNTNILNFHDFFRCNLSNLKLDNIVMFQCDLIKCNLKNSTLHSAMLSGTNLTGADLTGANLTGADLTGANLTGANLTGVDLTGADLTGANLIGANLTGADLTGADLTGAIISRIIITHTNFTEAKLAGTGLAEEDFSV